MKLTLWSTFNRERLAALTLMTVIALMSCNVISLAAYGQVTETSKFGSLSKHAFDGSASYCKGDNILFYNENTGEGLIGKASLRGLRITKPFRPGDFLPGWTHVARVDSINSILFYKDSTGEAALGNLDRGDFTTTQTYNNFAHGWTHILYVGLDYDHALFYNSATSAAALGFAPTAKVYRKGDFATGWTHMVWNNAGTLFYDTYHGSGAIAVPTVNGSPGPFRAPNDLKTPKWFEPGSFTTDWTHVVATRSHVFFYNRSDGSAAIGVLSPSNVETRKKYVPGRFLAQWTHVVNADGDMLLFYNALTGSVAIGEIVGDEFTTTNTDSVARGFTHVICGADAPPPPH